MEDRQSGVLAAAMRRGNVLAAECPSRDILKHVTSQWGTLVLMALMDGVHRFSELRRKIGGVSEKMLAQTLQQLEQDGFVRRISFPVVPPHVEYSLTPLGEGIGLHVQQLTDWIEHHLPQLLDAQGRQSAAMTEARVEA
ncbi:MULTISPECIES: helix-turn-helix domain-containing protein [unclassified Paludibacterium]|uniref:winged helix-turn-helix transcriptional regulator n=1 Tax=unclassified Paludibacterium TaxID=2618429 RepID=UPI00207B4289|nr:helix-turn-helix domain-containing protein [Paludibacterium sp. B53371]BEV73727.1 helix-turn-helix domain-containing protein [Paludibacterium sp. THUN1379]